MNVTTLIPAFKPKYLGDLIMGLANQTLRPARVYVSDDSPDQSFVRALQAPEYARVVAELKLTVVAGPRRGAFANLQNLLRLWNGESELFHFLFDDDILYPSFYERHVGAHRGQHYPCTISKRWTANEQGLPTGQLSAPRAIHNHGQRLLSIDSSALFPSVLPQCNNWLGEFSNCVMRGELAPNILDHRLADVSFYGLIDIGVFLAASIARPLGYLNDALGAFRTGPQQNTADLAGRNMKLSHFAWFALAIAGLQLGRLTPEQARQCCALMGRVVLSRYGQTPELAALCAPIPGLSAGDVSAHARFLDAWSVYIIDPPAQEARSA